MHGRGQGEGMSGGTFALHWVEIVTLTFVIFGIIVAFLSPSAFISYIVIFLSGMIAGRLLWERRNNTRGTYVAIILGFLAGFMLGSLNNYGNQIVIVVLFILGARLMYKLNEKGILADIFF